jgi:hypothetical protein
MLWSRTDATQLVDIAYQPVLSVIFCPLESTIQEAQRENTETLPTKPQLENIMRILRRLILAILTIGGLTTTFIATPASALPCAVCETPIKVEFGNCGFYADFSIRATVSLRNPWLYRVVLLTEQGRLGYGPHGDPTFERSTGSNRSLHIGSSQWVDLYFSTKTPGGHRSENYARLYVDLSAPLTEVELPFTGLTPYPATFYAKVTIRSTQTTTSTWHC